MEMNRLKRLLYLLADGKNVGEVWRESEYESLREAEEALRGLADSSCEEDTGVAADDSPTAPFELHDPDKKIDRLIVYADGASRGNPGPSAVAALAYLPSGELLTSASRRIGRATNNIAEYRAVLEGLRLARVLNAGDVTVRLDSELVVKQLNGVYRIKNKVLQSLAESVIREASRFRRCIYEHIPRSENKAADRLANNALKNKRD